jgi:hypothetical protein
VKDFIYSENIRKIEQFGQPVRNAFSKSLLGLTERHATNFARHTPDIVLNSNGYRSDEFTDYHEGKHILFSGYSNTFGLGLKREELWSSKLLSKIESSGQKVSGNFNISYPGSGIFEIVSNTIKYCLSYGMPDAVFVQILDMGRFYDIDDSLDEIKNVILLRDRNTSFLKKLFKQLEVYNYQYLMMLEAFCKTNGIDLFILSWGTEKYFKTRVDLENLYEPRPNEIVDRIASYMDKNPEDPFAIRARDNVHPGNGQQEYWAELAFTLYNKSVKENNVN